MANPIFTILLLAVAGLFYGMGLDYVALGFFVLFVLGVVFYLIKGPRSNADRD